MKMVDYRDGSIQSFQSVTIFNGLISIHFNTPHIESVCLCTSTKHIRRIYYSSIVIFIFQSQFDITLWQKQHMLLVFAAPWVLFTKLYNTIVLVPITIFTYQLIAFWCVTLLHFKRSAFSL